MNDIILAIKIVLRAKKSLLAFLLLTAALFWLFIAIPVINIPGNDFLFQLQILGMGEYILLITLATLTALSIVLNVHALRHKPSAATGLTLVGQGGVGYLSGTIASIFGTVTCAACVSAFFGFLGVSGVLFLVQYRTPITIGAILLLLISLYFTSRKVLGVCEDCRNLRKHKSHT